MLYSFCPLNMLSKASPFPLPRQVESRPGNEGAINHASPNLFSSAEERKKVGKKVAINNKCGISRSTAV